MPTAQGSCLWIVMNEKVIALISVYALQSGRKEEEKKTFHENLTAEVQSRNGTCFVLNLKGHVARFFQGYDEIHGGFGLGKHNRDRERILAFADSLDMVVGKTFFKKDDKKLITLKSGNCATGSDYAVEQKEAMKKVKDLKVIPREECVSEHILLIMGPDDGA